MTTTQNSTIIYRYEVAEIWYNPISKHHSLHAALTFNHGDIIAKFHAGITQEFATYLTVQIGANRHITLQPHYLQFVNHSCDPNVFFDTTNMQLVCIKAMGPGEEMCFFYPSTEWDMAQSFLCNCENKDCLQLINGAAHLNKATLQKYRLSDYIIQQLK